MNIEKTAVSWRFCSLQIVTWIWNRSWTLFADEPRNFKVCSNVSGLYPLWREGRGVKKKKTCIYRTCLVQTSPCSEILCANIDLCNVRKSAFLSKIIICFLVTKTILFCPVLILHTSNPLLHSSSSSSKKLVREDNTMLLYPKWLCLCTRTTVVHQ